MAINTLTGTALAALAFSTVSAGGSAYAPITELPEDGDRTNVICSDNFVDGPDQVIPYENGNPGSGLYNDRLSQCYIVETDMSATEGEPGDAFTYTATLTPALDLYAQHNVPDMMLLSSGSVSLVSDWIMEQYPENDVDENDVEELNNQITQRLDGISQAWAFQPLDFDIVFDNAQVTNATIDGADQLDLDGERLSVGIDKMPLEPITITAEGVFGDDTAAHTSFVFAQDDRKFCESQFTVDILPAPTALDARTLDAEASEPVAEQVRFLGQSSYASHWVSPLVVVDETQADELSGAFCQVATVIEPTPEPEPEPEPTPEPEPEPTPPTVDRPEPESSAGSQAQQQKQQEQQQQQEEQEQSQQIIIEIVNNPVIDITFDAHGNLVDGDGNRVDADDVIAEHGDDVADGGDNGDDTDNGDGNGSGDSDGNGGNGDNGDGSGNGNGNGSGDGNGSDNGNDGNGQGGGAGNGDDADGPKQSDPKANPDADGSDPKENPDAKGQGGGSADNTKVISGNTSGAQTAAWAGAGLLGLAGAGLAAAYRVMGHRTE